MKKLKVAYILIRFPVWSETFAANDLITSDKLGVDLTVYPIRMKSLDYKEFSYDGFGRISDKINYVSLRSIVIGLLLMIKYAFMTLSWLKWLIANEYKKPIVILKCLVLSPQCFYIWRELKNNNFTTVHLFWGHYSATIGYLVKLSKIKTNLSTFLGAYDLELGLNISRDIANMSDCVWTHSQYNIDMLVKMGINKSLINVSHRGIDLKRVETKSVDKNKFKIVTVGRLTKAKAFDDVIRVFSHIKKTLPMAELHILGDGEEMKNLLRLTQKLSLEKSITFHGKSTHYNVLTEMAESSIFLFMSKYKGDRLPNVVKEAMANECCCIVSDTSGIEELVDHGRTGFIVSMSDTQSAANLSLKVMVDDQLMQAMGKSASEEIESRFSVDVSIQKYLDVWQNLEN